MSNPNRFRRSKYNGKDLKLLKEYRQSKFMVKIWSILSKPENVDGLTTREIIVALPFNPKYYVDGKPTEEVNLKSSASSARYRTLRKMARQGSITRERNQKTREIIWKKNPSSPLASLLTAKTLDEKPPPWTGICGKGCWFAKTDRCECKCKGKYHGKGNE